MRSFGVEVLPEAEAEARDAFLWYFDRSPIAADAFRVELLQAIDGLGETAMDCSQFRINAGAQGIGKIAETPRRRNSTHNE